MRILSALLFIALISGCSTTKKTQQAKINADYDARTKGLNNQAGQSASRPADSQRAEPQRNDRPSSTTPVESRPAVVQTPPPVKVATDGPAVGTSTSLSTKTTGEWVVTSIKGKFLANDSTSVRVYMDLTAKTPTGAPVLNPTDFSEHFLIAYVMYPDYNNRERLGYGTVPLNA